MPETSIALSPSAARRIAQLVTGEGRPGLRLRLSVEGGGCSGFQYKFDLDDRDTQGDVVIARDGAEMVVDDVSVDLLAGAELDYVEDLTGSYFRVNNPNATSSCGCGTSFAL